MRSLRRKETVNSTDPTNYCFYLTIRTRYNPILGEIFRCRYDYPDGTVGYYIAEQVSHHPPISAFYYISVDHKVIIRGELRPKSRFLGNSVANMMEGANRIAFLDRQEDGEYVISMPNMCAWLLRFKVRRQTDSNPGMQEAFFSAR